MNLSINYYLFVAYVLIFNVELVD